MKMSKTRLIVKISVIALGVSLFTSAPSQAEELYTLQNANGQLTAGATLVCSDDVCGPNGSFSTNAATMAQISASYGCSPTPCTFVHVNSQTRQPISADQEAAAAAAAKAAADAATAASAKLASEAAAAAAAATIASGGSQQQADAAAASTNAVSGIGIVLDSVSQNDIQFGICFYSRNQSRISYTNVSYSWEVKDGSQTLDLGSGPPSGVTLIESGACNYGNSKVVNVRVSNLKPATTYYVETRGSNAGVQFSNREAFTTQAAPIFIPVTGGESATAISESATSVMETRTVTILETRTVTVADTPAVQPASSSPTPIAEVASSTGAIPLDSDGEEIDAPPAAEITVVKESSGKYLIKLDSNVYEDQLLVRAFKKGSKVVVFKVTTNIDGLAAIRTSRNLLGFKLAVYIGDQFLDSVKI